MGPELTKAILGLTSRMMTLKAIQEDEASAGEVNERELLILNLLSQKGRMNVSDIAEEIPTVSYSTISTDITRLWREKNMVTKTVDPENQRITLVELTDKGREVTERVQKHRDGRLHKLYKAMNTTQEEEEVIIRVTNRAIDYFDNLPELSGHKSTEK